MTLDEIKRGESKNVEFKVQLPDDSKKYMKTIIAYANTSGGKIMIGVDDLTKEVVGVDPSSVFKIMDKIANAVSDMCVPQIVPDITFQTLEGKCIVQVEIYPGQNRPYYIRSQGKENGTYIRVAGTSRPADEAILKDLEYQGAGKSFDEVVNVEMDYSEEDTLRLCSDIRRYISESKEIPVSKVGEITAVNLENWGILKKIGQTYLPTNAFILLTNNTFRFAKIQCALFKGENRAVFIDRREFEGPIYEQIEDAYKFVLKHINLGAIIDGVVRKDRYELPPESIREAIINAVCHRCYLDHSCVQVAIYDNRVEITSPGMLYGGLTMEQAISGRSKIRNVCVAEVFSRMGIIEQWGTGIQRMIQGCKEYEVREPEFIDMGDAFRVNFYRSGTETSIEKNQTGTEIVDKPYDTGTESMGTGIQNIVKGLHNSKMEAISILSETEKKVVRLIFENPDITQERMAENIGMSKNGVRYVMDRLKEKGILKREGSTKKGKWIITI
ncbi:MAG: putative DNA binding domain-containing protein [Lachnospiraceae bacterium]|nr:putative DNA binding domain-containing protein [Lachnospiraceae bacterium]MCM1238120.1 putative DNA binding domain-containing protein [Lachnospiraceae bacterium]